MAWPQSTTPGQEVSVAGGKLGHVADEGGAAAYADVLDALAAAGLSARWDGPEGVDGVVLAQLECGLELCVMGTVAELPWRRAELTGWFVGLHPRIPESGWGEGEEPQLPWAETEDQRLAALLVCVHDVLRAARGALAR